MLIKFIDHKDKTHWVNPAYVKWIREKGSGKVHVDITGSAVGIMVKGNADDIAGLINLAVQEAALLGMGPLAGNATPSPAQLAADAQQSETAQAAMISSVVIGG